MEAVEEKGSMVQVRYSAFSQTTLFSVKNSALCQKTGGWGHRPFITGGLALSDPISARFKVYSGKTKGLNQNYRQITIQANSEF